MEEEREKKRERERERKRGREGTCDTLAPSSQEKDSLSYKPREMIVPIVYQHCFLVAEKYRRILMYRLDLET
jgi:hypothetical protein